MKEEASEQNGNEKHIFHHILSWCDGHKMKLAKIVGTILLGTMVGVYLNEEQTFDVKVSISPSEALIGEVMDLAVKINPLKYMNGDIQIELVPQNYYYMTLRKSYEGDEQFVCDEDKQTCTYDMKNITLEPEEERTYKFYVTSTCDSAEAVWYIQVYVRYTPEISPDEEEEHSETLYITVKRSDVPTPPNSLESSSIDIFCRFVIIICVIIIFAIILS